MEEVNCKHKYHSPETPIRLLQYDIDIQYLPGKRNVIADALSKVPTLPPKVTDIKAINCIAENELSVNIPASKTKMEEFQDSTCRDIILQEYKGWSREQKDCPGFYTPIGHTENVYP